MTKGIGLCGSGNRDCSAISIRISEKALMDNGKANTKASEDFGRDDILAIMKEYVLGVTEQASTTVCVVAGAMEVVVDVIGSVIGFVLMLPVAVVELILRLIFGKF